MKFLPGVVYVSCPRCQGAGRITVPMPAFPRATVVQMRVFNVLATSLVLRLMFAMMLMLGITVAAGVSPWEIARQSVLAGLVVAVISVAGGFAVQWVLRVLTTLRCPTCLGRRWVPGQIPP